MRVACPAPPANALSQKPGGRFLTSAGEPRRMWRGSSRSEVPEHTVAVPIMLGENLTPTCLASPPPGDCTAHPEPGL